MRSRLSELPRYGSRDYAMPAAYYNRVRLALLRLETPLRLALPGLRTLEIYLDEEVWVCLDASLNDFPILAWLDFSVDGRTSLHEPVACRLCTYHAHATMIEERVLELTENLLRQRFRGDDPGEMGGNA